MERTPFENDLLTRVRTLSEDERRRVMSFAEALADTHPVGVPGSTLLHFAGTFEAETLRDIERAVEEGCERVDADEW